jgi:S-(hydroxymethyl)glutathione dehydrogenase/alcohol dehydrogenase
VEEVDLDAPQTAEVMVELVGAGVCHSDYHFLDGHITASHLPFVMGHEGAGIVREVGPGVASVSPGDHVIFSMDTMCGYCRNCTQGRPTLCETYGRSYTLPDGTTRFSRDGVPYYSMVATFSERTVVPADKVVRIRDDAPLEQVCLIGCAVVTGVGSVVNRAKVEPGSTVAVVGCGGVGLNVIQGARLLNASQVIAVDIREGALEFATKFGATHSVNATHQDAVARVKEITGGRGADYTFEVYGSAETVETAYAMARKGGTVVVVGIAPMGETAGINAVSLVREEKVLKGTYYGSARCHVDMPKIVDMYLSGRLDLDELITRRYSLDQINEAYEDLEAGGIGRGVIVF